MLPALVVSEAVGYATTSDPKNTFDDLKDVGLWPAHQYIKKVTSISVWIGAAKPNGIEITYQLSNTTQPSVQMHGQRSGTQKTVTVAGEFGDFFVGIFGAIDDNADQPTLRRIGFLVYNKDTGALTQQGPFPDATVTTKNTVGFTSLGLIVGFSGTTASNGNLDTVAVYKIQSGGSTNFGITDLFL
ncbi:hypothetical protein D9615_009371 [Tricholomella constricta]|uniref:Jacalin-type lectin domain-containing protein n=1 Tax=Tricholomella constricta TaxID=117010 RepID=A0A8H5H2Y0_9AGAR|nr:hypothetical protein D9615_009371 [Tricholomella constricta]